MWLAIQMAPVKNDQDVTVLFLLTFKDVTSIRQPIVKPNKSKLNKYIEHLSDLRLI